MEKIIGRGDYIPNIGFACYRCYYMTFVPFASALRSWYNTLPNRDCEVILYQNSRWLLVFLTSLVCICFFAFLWTLPFSLFAINDVTIESWL